MGVETLHFGFATPQKHFLARNRVVCRILRQHRCARFGCSLSQETPSQKIAESLCAEGCEITHAQNRNPWTDLDKILYDGRYHRRNYPHKFWWPSVKGFLGSVGSNFPLSHWLSSSSLQHYRASVWCGRIFKYTFVANISLSSSWREF